VTTQRVAGFSEKGGAKTRSVVTCALSMWYFLGLQGVEEKVRAAPTTLSGG